MLYGPLNRDLQRLRLQTPLIHNITNLVVMQHTANVLLALGASPIMAHAVEELEDLLNTAEALVLNIGTLDASWIDSMHHALNLAMARHIPVVLDPVGAGASQLRMRTTIALLERGGVGVLKGNATEILALAGWPQVSKGVDSLQCAEEAVHAAEQLSNTYHCIVVISGAIDYIVRGVECRSVSEGHWLMSRVTGMGCAAAAVIGAFLAINKDPFQATYHAMLKMALAGKQAAQGAQGPGSFVWRFYDSLCD